MKDWARQQYDNCPPNAIIGGVGYVWHSERIQRNGLRLSQLSFSSPSRIVSRKSRENRNSGNGPRSFRLHCIDLVDSVISDINNVETSARVDRNSKWKG